MCVKNIIEIATTITDLAYICEQNIIKRSKAKEEEVIYSKEECGTEGVATHNSEPEKKGGYFSDLVYVEGDNIDHQGNEAEEAYEVEEMEEGDKANQVVSATVQQDVLYTKGMTLMEFLHKNPDVRALSDVSAYFSRTAVLSLEDQGVLFLKRGKIII